MQQSNLYILLYTAALTIICAGLLALASEGLKEKQQANIDLERKQNILSTVMQLNKGDDIISLYTKKVRSKVIDYNGNEIKDLKAENVVVAAEYKKPAEQRLLPVYEFMYENDPSKVEYAVFPVYGYGLWNNIWGFISIKDDFNTVKGVNFQHAGETPGLGARITSTDIQSRYSEKTIFEGDEMVSIMMMKGEGLDYSNDSHKVDGMSGATLTGKGVNNMLKDYLTCYKNYLVNSKKELEMTKPSPMLLDSLGNPILSDSLKTDSLLNIQSLSL